MFIAVRTARRLSSDKGALRGAVDELGRTKVSDMQGSREQVRRISAGLFARYRERFAERDGGGAMPVFHVILALGIFGYSWEYPHLSKSPRTHSHQPQPTEHQRDNPEDVHA